MMLGCTTTFTDTNRNQMKFSSLFTVLSILLFLLTTEASTKKKRHSHNGILDVYDGKPIPFKVSAADEKKLSDGHSVLFNERSGKSGRGICIQDINATGTVCMDMIRDLPNYPKYISTLKTVDIYERHQFPNGTSRTAAKFEVGIMGMRLGYFLLLTHEPKYRTLTWTLDYKYASDFDDNVGHWQVMDHPQKKGWSRVLYSTKVKLFPWIPEFVVNFVTKKALVESTAWVKKESEKEQQRIGSQTKPNNPVADFKNPLAEFKNPFSDFKMPPNKFLPSWMGNGGFRPDDADGDEEAPAKANEPKNLLKLGFALRFMKRPPRC